MFVLLYDLYWCYGCFLWSLVGDCKDYIGSTTWAKVMRVGGGG